MLKNEVKIKNKKLQWWENYSYFVEEHDSSLDQRSRQFADTQQYKFDKLH